MSGGPRDRIAAADAARDARDWKRAARLYAQALELDPARDDIHVQHGHALKESGRPADAEAAYRRALALRPGVADTWMQLGHLMTVQQRIDEAAEAYVRAVERDRSMTDAVAGLRGALDRGAELAEDLRRAAARALRPPARRTRLFSTDAAALSRTFQDALDALGEGAPQDAVDAVRAGLEALPALSPPAPSGPVAVFDVSDLIGYFGHSRLPTGIQRVQIEVLSALLTDPDAQARTRVCAFHESRDGWVEVPPDQFLDLAEAALAGGDLAEPGWRMRLEALRTELALAPALRFPTGAWLINLGTSWWLQNYFLKVREAQRRFGVRYAPFVHDMIPIMAPEHCVAPLVRDFVSWALGVFDHADAFLTNSEASRADLLAVAERMGRSVAADRIRVVRLDAEFRKPQLALGGETVLQTHGLTPGGYMLFVSTIESRKNHIEVLGALQRMLRAHGPERTPRLVCVGGRGWLNDAVFKRLASDPQLARHVRMLSGMSDAELDALYRHCLFTLYPSLYEGWGLPVTESLSRGKAVLASNRSSIPEAGGGLAVYYRPGDVEALVEGMDRLSFDDAWRGTLERNIRERFRPRPWRALGADMLAAIDAWGDRPDGAAAPWPSVVPGRLHRLSRPTALGVGFGARSDEVFRDGPGWAPPEPWGCRARGAGADLVFRIDLSEGTPLRLHLGLSAPGEGRAYQIRVGDGPETKGHVLADSVRWAVVEATAPGPDRPVRVRLTATADDRPARSGERVEIGVLGFMVCAADDVSARADFAAGVASGGWNLQPPVASFD
ncbi:glycosyltransferase family 4 protein [Brevundimonas sp.]|uniref:glycosyltransferase family 4 protein n=1 Tax=Brevundimonas sp. TaxID=1871086 RepID=UPI002E14EC04|nr:glycosyltransferase [Brevundimonas sp.]